MAINLSRNTKVYFTTNVDATGTLADLTTGYTTTNTWEIGVMDGYSFGQTTQQQTITLSEGGNTPTRGQRAFNTQLDPVDWSFSSYIRPEITSTFVVPQERVLWNAMFGAGALVDAANTVAVTSLIRASTTGANASTATLVTTAALTINGTAAVAGAVVNINGATNSNGWNTAGRITAVTNNSTFTVELAEAPLAAAGSTALGTLKASGGQWGANAAGPTAANMFGYVTSMASNVNQLQRFGLLFVVDTVVYGIDNCAMDQVSVDFGLDAIAMAAWSGKGTKLKQMTTLTGTVLANSATANPSGADFITNKLSTMTIQSNIGGADNTLVASTSYTAAITGGNITIANNLNYLVPANLGRVNEPIGYFTGTRSITGNVTAYLRTGSEDGNANLTGKLLTDMLTAAAATTEPKYKVQLEMGGASNASRVEFEMPGVVLQIPAIDVADVVSTTLNFTAQGFDPNMVGAGSNAFDVTKTNDIQIRYFANP